MRKSLILTISIILLAIIMMTFVACTIDESNKYTLELVEKDKEYFEFTVGEIDWNQISFYVYDSENNILGEFVATESMVASEDLEKIYFAGTKTIRLRYQGAELLVTLKLNSPVTIREYTVVFDAGEGAFINYEGQPNVLTIKEDVLEAIPTPVRDGYEFLGWYEDKQGTGAKIITPYTLKRNLNLFAKWSDERKYNVSYVVYEDDRRKESLDGVYNVEHGTNLILYKYSEKIGYTFDRYEIYNLDDTNAQVVNINYDVNANEYTYGIYANLEIRLRYSTKMITLTYISDAWEDGTIVGGVEIVGGVYRTQVPYNTVLQKNILPVPSLPEKVGYDGTWIDNATSQEPIYNKATVDLLITAKYDIKSYSMYFYDEDNRIIANATRTVPYNTFIDQEPIVPDKTGYNGVWKVTNRGYNPNFGEGELIEFPLKQIAMVEDVNVYAYYTPKVFNINFHYRMDGMDENVTETLKYEYGERIPAIDLTLDREIDGTNYPGYDGKYYEILWYTSPTLSKEKKATFPVDVVDNADFYFDLARRPYKVEFRLPDVEYLKDVEFNPEPIYVEVGKDVVPPQIIMQGYEVVAWYYYEYAPMYDANTSYTAGDYVYYEGSYYSAIRDSVGIAPTNNSYWMIGAQRVWYSVEEYANGIPVDDFHEYSEDAFYDRAFYASVDVKQFSVSFNNLTISQGADGYSYDYTLIGEPQLINYATVGITAPATLVTPSYPDGTEGRFIFEGWYTESNFVTLPVDLATLKITKDVTLYAKWSDELIGTEGLIYEADDIDNPSSYTVVGFETTLAEYSHVTLRIPNNYKGKPVVAIADNAFAGFDKTLFIDEIIIPANVVNIGDNAFTACYSLQKFNVEANNNFVVDQYGVLYSEDKSILYSAITILSNSELNSYVIPSSVVKLRGGAFANLINLKNIIFEEGTILTEIGAYAFDGCTALSSINIPNSVETIGEYAFRMNYSLATIQIDKANSNLIKVGEGAFEDCLDALTVAYNNNVATYLMLGNVLISYVGDEVDLVLDNNIVSIADGAFNRNLTDNNASNYQLARLTIGENSNLVYIGNKVFLSCGSLKEISILTDSKVEIENDSFNGIALSAKLYVNEDLLDEYASDDNYLVFGKDNILGA